MILNSLLLIAAVVTLSLGVDGLDLSSTLNGVVSGGLDYPSIVRGALATVGMTENCATMASYNDTDLGYIDAAPDVYCKDVATLRIVPNLTCCAPQTPEAMAVKFQLYDPATGTYKPLDWRNRASPLDAEKPVHFLAHGWLEEASISPYFLPTVVAMAKRDYQSIAIIWDKANQLQPFQAFANVRAIGMQVAFMIHNWDIADRTKLVGMLTGGQILGEAGKQLKKLSKGTKKIAHCIGADLAGPGFDGGSDDMRLTMDDCAIVEVIHSSAGSLQIPVLPSGFINLAFQQLGTSYKSGHCDYWVNCGHFQPNCYEAVLDFASLLTMTSTPAKRLQFAASNGFYIALCAHARSAMVYYSSAAGLCDYKTNVCTDCEKGFVLDGGSLAAFVNNPLSCTYAGEGYKMPPQSQSQCTSTDNKNFYVSSAGTKPYCNTQPLQLTGGSPLSQFG